MDELGIGKGSLYGSFGSKRELFGRALDHYRQVQGDTLTEILRGTGPVKERLRASLGLIIEANADDPDRRGCLAVNTAAELGGSDRPATDAVAAMFTHNEAEIEHAITIGQASGEIRSDIPAKGLAAQVLATGVGLQLLAKTVADPRDLQPAVDALIATL